MNALGAHAVANRAATAAVSLLLMQLPWSAAVAAGDYCDRVLGVIPGAAVAAAVLTRHAGRYINHRYGYSVRLPHSYSATAVAADGLQRGFDLWLSAQPAAVLTVDALYDVHYDVAAAAVQKRDLDAMRLQVQRVLRVDSTQAALAGVAGRRYVAYVQCGPAAQSYVHDDTVVIRDREIYRVHLQTTAERYGTDVKVANDLLRSWRWETLQ